jgi:hypothetical protein
VKRDIPLNVTRHNGTIVRRAGAVALLALLAFEAGCDSTRISDITSNPGRYQGKSVTVAGEVTQSFALLGMGAYQINDGTGSLWVISTGSGVPGKGIRVEVTGQFQSGVTIQGKSLGNAITQTHGYRTLQ